MVLVAVTRLLHLVAILRLLSPLFSRLLWMISSFYMFGEDNWLENQDLKGNDGEVRSNENANENKYQNAITVADPTGEMYYSQYLQGVEGSGAGLKEMMVDNGAGFSGRKDGSSTSVGSGESLRAILSDPLTGALMDDAMILPCGHSFGTSRMEHVMRMDENGNKWKYEQQL